ncbi:hypothetical protein B0J12DRAFT_420188 [Macrophomina phaseolina]|uniref:AMP-dependent synthetase/ligase n=1 Tax=Macrophomina phaseolina TaxID=35725 RepID=A0ABQ8FR68_9PEZI|nr:hypothetical protein B0J12DRAFT_420188 [Macrophomina phaseolina]
MVHFYQDALTLPTHFNFAEDVVDYSASKLSTITAMYWVPQSLDHERILTFGHFSRQSHRATIMLSRLGLRKGDRIMIILPRIPEW